MPTGSVVLLGVCAVWFAFARLGASYPAFEGDDAIHFLYSTDLPIWQTLTHYWWPHHPPTYFVLLSSWAAFGTSESSLRLLNQLFATGILLLAFLIARTLSGEIAAWVTLSVFACCPMLFELGVQIRGYVPALFFCMLSLQFFLLWVTESKRRYLFLGTALTAAAVFTEYGSVLLVGPVMFYIASLQARTPRKLAAFCGAQLLWLLCVAVIYARYLNEHVDIVHAPYLATRVFHSGADQSRIGFFVETLQDAISGFGTWVLVYLVLLAVTLRNRATVVWMLLAGPVLFSSALAALSLYPGGYTRHGFFLLLPIALTMGLGVQGVWDKIETRLWSKARFVIPVLCCIFCVSAGYRNYEWEKTPRYFSENFRSISKRVKDAAQRGDLVVLDSASMQTMEYYNRFSSRDGDAYQTRARDALASNEFIFRASSICAHLPKVFGKLSQDMPEAENILMIALFSDFPKPSNRSKLPFELEKIGNSYLLSMKTDKASWEYAQKWCERTPLGTPAPNDIRWVDLSRGAWTRWAPTPTYARFFPGRQ